MDQELTLGGPLTWLFGCQGEARDLEAQVAAAAVANAEAGAAVAALSARVRERLRYEDAEVEVGRKQRQVRRAPRLPACST